MAKKKDSDSPAPHPPAPANSIESSVPDIPAQVSPEVKERMERMKHMLDKFKEKILAKFEGYILGIALAPPEQEGERKDKVNVLILIDDQDSNKMGKDELHDKLTKAMEAIAADVDPQIAIDVLLLTELFQSCYDGKYDLLQILAISAPVYDEGWLGAIKICEIHKSMVIKKFEKYIACYVLGGSLVRGKANPNSDIDVYIVIDDTDVKKMTRAELKDKLRGIISDFAVEAGKMTGIQNKLSIQVYILTDFWDNIKEANPIIFTFLRDGVPLYDRGIFMPWKYLLKMGKIRPSSEAIDLYRATGEQMLDRVRFKLKEIAIEDMWYATVTPSQAAIMLYGLPPPAPRELPDVLREIFVKKEKLFDDEHVKFLELVIKMHKDVEYGIKKNVTGGEVQEMLDKADKYLKALNRLYESIEERKELDSTQHVYESVVTVIRDVLTLEGVEKASDEESVRLFEREVVHKGIIPERYLRILKEIHKAKKEYDAGKLSRADISELHKNANELLKHLVEHIQRKRGKELERARIRVKYGDKFGEAVLLDTTAFVTLDLDAQEKEVLRGELTKEGRITNLQTSTLEEMEHTLASSKIPPRVFMHEKLFEDMKKIFGGNVEILMGY
jgi:predicted nucleotidyltransferase/Skp family chaperone for outer membrane proteins